MSDRHAAPSGWPVTSTLAQNMSFFQYASLFLCCTAWLHAIETLDPKYQDALDAALRINPPGDYGNRPPMRAWAYPWRTAPKTIELSQRETYLMKRVDAANLPLEQLFSEAASYFSTGRWDLAMKRYKQCLVVDPSNREAKANLYDIFTLQCLSPDGKDSQEFFLKATELKKRLSKDIIQK